MMQWLCKQRLHWVHSLGLAHHAHKEKHQVVTVLLIGCGYAVGTVPANHIVCLTYRNAILVQSMVQGVFHIFR